MIKFIKTQCIINKNLFHNTIVVKQLIVLRSSRKSKKALLSYWVIAYSMLRFFNYYGTVNIYEALMSKIPSFKFNTV